jgi:hypothetical protein
VVVVVEAGVEVEVEPGEVVAVLLPLGVVVEVVPPPEVVGVVPPPGSPDSRLECG